MRQNQGQTSNPRGEKAHTAYQAVGWAAGAPRVDGQVAPPFVCTSYRTAPSHSRALQLPNVLRPAHQMRPQVARVCGKPRGTSSRPLKGPASDSQLSRPRLLLTPRGSSPTAPWFSNVLGFPTCTGDCPTRALVTSVTCQATGVRRPLLSLGLR